MSYDILVYGPLFCDLIFTDMPRMPALGTEVFAGDLTIAIGGSAIVAAWLHKLGARDGLVAELGSDPLSQVARRLLDELGLDQTLIREHPYPLPQVTVALSFPQDRAFITRFKRPKSPPDLAAILHRNSAKHLHVCGFLAALETPDICQIAHAAGLTVSMDSGWDEEALRDPQLAAVISELDLFLPNRRELCYIGQVTDLEQAAARVAATMRDGMIVVKRGPEGAVAYDSNGEVRAQVSALPVTPVDTTGAGDAFDAGFLYAYVNGLSLTTCMQYGAVCGGLATTFPGGAGAIPTAREVQRWLAKLPS